MKDFILVLTNSQDGCHSDVVIAKLKSRGQNVFRFDVDKIAQGEVKINYSAGVRGVDCRLSCFDQELSLNDIQSIWYRRPNHFNLQFTDSVQKAYAESETKSFLDGLWEIVPNIFWFNNPKSLERARKKIFQLQLAEKIGFKIPETIVTNDSEKVKEFFYHKKKIVFKAIYHEFLNYADKGFNIPTTLITEQHLEHLDLVTKTPCLFQKFIDKAYELRVTVVGEKFFPIKIDSQKNPQTVVDWRNPEFIDKLKYELVDLPDGIIGKCAAMMKELNLVFGAFDFVIDKNDQWYFLEINPNGQWYWLEDLTGVLISDAIVDILINRPSG